MHPFKVLIPLDETAFSRNVLPHVQRFLRPEDYELILFHVATVPDSALAGISQPLVMQADLLTQTHAYATTYDSDPGRYVVDDSPEWDSARAALIETLQDDVQMLQDAGYTVSVAAQFGNPNEEIVEFVDQHGIDMVAMATHGRTGFKRLVMGSVAEDVLHHLSVPALLVHSIDEE